MLEIPINTVFPAVLPRCCSSCRHRDESYRCYSVTEAKLSYKTQWSTSRIHFVTVLPKRKPISFHNSQRQGNNLYVSKSCYRILLLNEIRFSNISVTTRNDPQTPMILTFFEVSTKIPRYWKFSLSNTHKRNEQLTESSKRPFCY